MSKSFIEKSIEISAPISNVWSVFTDPVLTRQMGGEYISDWKVGSAFRWKGGDGTIITNGSIVDITPGRRLKHSLFNSVGSIHSVITYELEEENSVTTLHAREDFAQPITENKYADAAEGWDTALLAVKETAEKYHRGKR